LNENGWMKSLKRWMRTVWKIDLDVEVVN
jgi:hypothetical protein